MHEETKESVSEIIETQRLLASDQSIVCVTRISGQVR